MTKLSNNKGFTLVELLIVIAIIAILAAVALPVYTAQIETARESVDAGVVRSAASLAQSDYLLGGFTEVVPYAVYTNQVGDTNNVYVVADISSVTNVPANYTVAVPDSTWDLYKGISEKNMGKNVALEISNGGEVTGADFA